MTARKKPTSPKARPGNRNAAKPEGERRVVLAAQRVEPETLATYREAGTRYGGIGRALDVAATMLRESEARLRRALMGPR